MGSTRSSRSPKLTAAYIALSCLCAGQAASAATEAHLIRADARSMDRDQAPILSTLIDIGESGPNGFEPRPFPEDAVLELEGALRPAELIDHTLWSTHTEPGSGTAWLVVLDADRRMGGALPHAKDVALALLASLRPNDAIDVVVLDDRQVVADSKWRDSAARAEVATTIRGAVATGAQRNRGLATLLEETAKTGFGSLLSAKLRGGTPLHQAFVVISSGYGGTDPKTSGPGGSELGHAFEQGRYPENNSALPRAPIPVVSLSFAADALPEYRHAAAEFMRGLANPRVGGSHQVLDAWDDESARRIVGRVRARFDAMHLVRWRLPCVAPGPTQSLRLEFPRAKTPILGDATFRDVPLGAPLRFPLLIDAERTRAEASKAGGVAPGDRIRVYGRFCWASENDRARAYFLPRGTLLPESLEDTEPSRVEESRSELVRSGLSAPALRTDPSFVEIEVPTDSRIVGSGPTPEIRLVIEDESGPRTSGLTAKRTIVVPARRRLPSWLVWSAGVLALAAVAGTWLMLRRRR